MAILTIKEVGEFLIKSGIIKLEKESLVSNMVSIISCIVEIAPGIAEAFIQCICGIWALKEMKNRKELVSMLPLLLEQMHTVDFDRSTLISGTSSIVFLSHVLGCAPFN